MADTFIRLEKQIKSAARKSAIETAVLVALLLIAAVIVYMNL